MKSRVLVPVDESAQAERAFEFALEEWAGATIALVHVIDPVGAFEFMDPEEEDQIDTVDIQGYQREKRKQRERAERMLEEYRKRAAERGFEAETIVAVGKPVDKILETVEEGEFDHVVMGSHGRTGVGRVLFGSVAEHVTRRSPTPVTIVR